MARTRRQLRADIMDNYRFFGDFPPGLTEDWLNTHLNEAVRQVSKDTEAIDGTGSITVTAGTRTYSLATEFIKIARVEWGTSHANLERISPSELQYVNGDRWRISTGGVQNYYMEGDRRLGIYNIPITGSGATAYVYGPKYARSLTADTTTSELPTSLDKAVVEYVCAELSGLDEQAPPDREGRFQGRYSKQIMAYLNDRPIGQELRFVGPRI